MPIATPRNEKSQVQTYENQDHGSGTVAANANAVREPKLPVGKLPVFRWNGEYFGFVYNNTMYNAHGRYLGWLDANYDVWDIDGSFIGELVETSYILRRTNTSRDPVLPPGDRPISPIPRIPAVHRIGRLPRLGWEDALNDYT